MDEALRPSAFESNRSLVDRHLHHWAQPIPHLGAESGDIQPARYPGSSKKTEHLEAENTSIGSIGISAVEGLEQGEQASACDGGQATGVGIASTPDAQQETRALRLDEAEHQGEAGIDAHPERQTCLLYTSDAADD